MGLIKEEEVSQWSVLSACNEAMLDGHQLGIGSCIMWVCVNVVERIFFIFLYFGYSEADVRKLFVCRCFEKVLIGTIALPMA